MRGQAGQCGAIDRATVAAAMKHFGEEPPLSGSSGSGTVFFSGCNAACIFCQNYQISALRQGKPYSSLDLCNLFLNLQSQGCCNINLVTPTPHISFIMESLCMAFENGLSLPVVYNTNGYIEKEILSLLDGVIDIYLPDMKYSQDVWAEEFSGLKEYSSINQEAVREMYRQTGALNINESGIATRGLLIRHLLLPEGVSGYKNIFAWIANLDPSIPVSIMSQYQPCFKADTHSILNRRITKEEYLAALEAFQEAGLTDSYSQIPDDLEKHDGFFPDFTQPVESVFESNAQLSDKSREQSS